MFVEALHKPPAMYVRSHQHREGVLTSCHRWVSNGWVAGLSFPHCTFSLSQTVHGAGSPIRQFNRQQDVLNKTSYLPAGTVAGSLVLRKPGFATGETAICNSYPYDGNKNTTADDASLL